MVIKLKFYNDIIKDILRNTEKVYFSHSTDEKSNIILYTQNNISVRYLLKQELKETFEDIFIQNLNDNIITLTEIKKYIKRIRRIFIFTRRKFNIY